MHRIDRLRKLYHQTREALVSGATLNQRRAEEIAAACPFQVGDRYATKHGYGEVTRVHYRPRHRFPNGQRRDAWRVVVKLEKNVFDADNRSYLYDLNGSGTGYTYFQDHIAIPDYTQAERPR